MAGRKQRTRNARGGQKKVSAREQANQLLLEVLKNSGDEQLPWEPGYAKSQLPQQDQEGIASGMLPHNPQTGRSFTGGNQVHLLVRALHDAQKDGDMERLQQNEWMTARQANLLAAERLQAQGHSVWGVPDWRNAWQRLLSHVREEAPDWDRVDAWMQRIEEFPRHDRSQHREPFHTPESDQLIALRAQAQTSATLAEHQQTIQNLAETELAKTKNRGTAGYVDAEANLLGMIHKGARSEPIEFWKREEKTRKDEDGNPVLDPTTGEPLTQMRMIPFTASVFHAQDLDLPPRPQAEQETQESLETRAGPDQQVQRLVQALEHDGVRFKQGDPAYYPALDMITVPPLTAYQAHYAQQEEDESTAHQLALQKRNTSICHEGFHAAGAAHRTNGLERIQNKSLSSRESYAYEEMVVQIAAMQAQLRFGIPMQDARQHADYIANWGQRAAGVSRDQLIEAIESGQLDLYEVSNEAQRRINYLDEIAQQLEVSPDETSTLEVSQEGTIDDDIADVHQWLAQSDSPEEDTGPRP